MALSVTALYRPYPSASCLGRPSRSPNGRGLRITKAELLELSLVSVLANPDRVVGQRDACGSKPMSVSISPLRHTAAQRQILITSAFIERSELSRASTPVLNIINLRNRRIDHLKRVYILKNM